MGRRHQARALALQALYLLEYCGSGSEEAVAAAEAFGESDGEVRGFARGLVAAVQGNRAEIDRLIAAAAENWSLERMAVIDRNILRLGAAQLRFMEGAVPPKVAIDESIELAKRFGEEESSRFINGILDRIYRDAQTNGPEGGSR